MFKSKRNTFVNSLFLQTYKYKFNSAKAWPTNFIRKRHREFLTQQIRPDARRNFWETVT